MRIVVVEDNHTLAKAIQGALQDQGFGVDWLPDGLSGENFLRQSRPDIAIVDINLPGQSGLELIRSLRRSGDTMPILVLTARAATSQRVEGLETGADDYLVKPFEMAELIARLRALSRRRPVLDHTIVPLGLLTYDQQQRSVSTAQGRIELPRRELALFECLLENRGRIISRAFLSDTLYGTGAEVEANALDLLISRLRRKLEGTKVQIRTARGLGYMMDGDSP